MLSLTLAAKSQNNRLVVNGNDDINRSIPDSIKFKYPGFSTGRVFFKDGTVGGSSLNYNLLAGEIQFVSPSGDTMALANEGLIKSISLNQDTFYYDNIYLQRVAGNEVAKLAKNEKMKLSDIKKGGGFDNYTSSGGIENVSALNIGSRTLHLADNKRMYFTTRTSFYIGDAYNHFLPATKKNVLRMFGKNKAVESFIEENKIDFNKREDLEKLVAFIGENKK